MYKFSCSPKSRVLQFAIYLTIRYFRNAFRNLVYSVLCSLIHKLLLGCTGRGKTKQPQKVVARLVSVSCLASWFGKLLEIVFSVKRGRRGGRSYVLRRFSLLASCGTL